MIRTLASIDIEKYWRWVRTENRLCDHFEIGSDLVPLLLDTCIELLDSIVLPSLGQSEKG